jgi:transcriptional regulator with XRE-family HTH domain
LEPTSPASNDDAQWQEFGARLRELRRAHDLTQGDVAESLGVVPSWVSQVEAAKFRPSPDAALALSQMLGTELRVLALGKGDPHGVTEPETAGFALLWRARADLLARAVSGAETRPQRRRLDLLSRELISVASTHPNAQAFRTGGQLRSLLEISDRNYPWIRRLVAVEVAAMKLDAPFQINVARESVLEQLDYVLENLGDHYDPPAKPIYASIATTAGGSIAKTVGGPPRGLDRPNWRDLACVGGARGVAQAMEADPHGGLRLLLGDDPVGWFGFDFIAGTWLVRPAFLIDAAHAHSVELVHHREPEVEPQPAPTPSLAPPHVPVTVGLIAGSLLLGPVLGGVVSAALGGLPVGQVITGFAARQTNPDNPEKSSHSEGGTPDSPSLAMPNMHLYGNTLDLAEAFGRHWVRLELTKVLAFYLAFPEIALHGDAAAKLPTKNSALQYLRELARLSDSRLHQEVEASGTPENAENERIRELTDIRDALAIAAKALEQP